MSRASSPRRSWICFSVNSTFTRSCSTWLTSIRRSLPQALRFGSVPLEDQSPVPAYAADPARQVDRALAVPVGEQRVEGTDVLVEQLGVAGAGPERRQAQDAAADGGRELQEPGDGKGIREHGVRRVGEVVEVLDVRAQQVGRAGEVLGDARAQLGLEQGQHVATDPGPGEARVL